MSSLFLIKGTFPQPLTLLVTQSLKGMNGEIGKGKLRTPAETQKGCPQPAAAHIGYICTTRKTGALLPASGPLKLISSLDACCSLLACVSKRNPLPVLPPLITHTQ